MDEQQFQALPEQQRKRLQQQLKDQGLYDGSIDGLWGPGTAAAFQAQQMSQREDEGPTPEEIRQQELQREGERQDALVEIGQIEATGDLEAARNKALELGLPDEARRIGERIEQTESEDPWSVVRRAGANAAWIPGVAVGRWMGQGANTLADKAQESRNRSLRTAAENRLTGLATREGATSAAERAGAVPPKNAFLRTIWRMAPHALLGGAMAGKGALTYFGVDEDDPRIQQDIDTAIGLGAIGAGSGLVERGVQYAKNPGVSPDAGDLSIIESKQLRRDTGQNRMLGGGQTIEGQALPPQESAPNQSSAPATRNVDDVARDLESRFTREQLREQARKAGLKVSGSKTELAQRLASYDKPIKGRVSRAARNAGDKASRAVLPLTVGAMAADAAYNAAEAGGGAIEPGTGRSAEGNNTNRLLATTGAAAGGTAAGYGVQRGLERAGEFVARNAPMAARVGGRALPVAGAGLMAYDAYRVGRDANIDPGPKYPTTRDIGAQYREQMGYGQTQGEEDAGFERDLNELRMMMDYLP
jgi:hypothetical protein